MNEQKLKSMPSIDNNDGHVAIRLKRKWDVEKERERNSTNINNDNENETI